MGQQPLTHCSHDFHIASHLHILWLILCGKRINLQCPAYVVIVMPGVIMVLAASCEFDKRLNSEVVERPSDNEEIPEVRSMLFDCFFIDVDDRP